MPRTKSVRVRRATPEDIAVLEDVETRSFPKYKISTRRQLRLSLKSPYQAVWIAEIRLSRSYVPCGAMVVHLHKKSVRLFSICVLPEHRGKGTGDAMLSHLEQYALANSFTRITLEAKSDDERLLAWYQNAGFVRSVLLSDYYAAGIDAVRMFRTVPGTSAGGSLENIIIVDRRADWTIEISGVAIVSAREYITQARFLNSPNFRVFNLCGSYRYQSVGYYVSLLASAREHRAIPNITTIRDFGDLHLIRSVSSEIDELIQTALARTDDQSIAFNIYFGQTIDPAFRTLGSRLYSLFEAPLFTVEFRRKKRWEIIKATPVPFRKVPAEHYET
ncbi:MAG: GNAT family N-acetyltransferase, partial [Spirochaetota bacterium]